MPHIDPTHCFPGQRPDERTVIFARHHWVFDLAIFLRFILYSIIPAIIFIVVASMINLNSNLATKVFLFFYCWYVMFVSIGSYMAWLKRYLDYIIFTTDRLLDVDQVGLFEQVVSETSLSEIQDVSCHIPGFWGSIFRYGNLNIQTAADKAYFNIKYLPHPMVTRSKILGLRDRYIENVQATAYEEAMKHRSDQGNSSVEPLPPSPQER